MVTLKVKFNKINDVKDFVNATTLCNFDIDIISGKYVANAKSIMGIFGLDLDNILTVEIFSDNCEELLNKIKPFIVE